MYACFYLEGYFSISYHYSPFCISLFQFFPPLLIPLLYFFFPVLIFPSQFLVQIFIFNLQFYNFSCLSLSCISSLICFNISCNYAVFLSSQLSHDGFLLHLEIHFLAALGLGFLTVLAHFLFHPFLLLSFLFLSPCLCSLDLSSL